MSDQLTVELVGMELIDPPGHQLRERIDDESLGQLADSLASSGLHQPIGLRPTGAGGRFEIVYGHRRWLAASLLRWGSIPARLYPLGFDPLLAAVEENLQREQLNPVEEARALRRFLDKGYSITETARQWRRSYAWVSNRLDMLSWPADVQRAVQDGQLAVSVGECLAQVDEDQYRAYLIQEAVQTGAKAPQARVWLAHFQAERERIVGNFYTVQSIIERREAWRIQTECQCCHQFRVYEETRSWRLCVECTDSLTEAIGERDKAVARGELPADPREALGSPSSEH